jgi:glutamate/tyrosine decarboxylase-like PLP-dependent enzyme
VAGAERADSWATDAHKWLNVPYDSGLAIFARSDDVATAMAIDAAYLPPAGERQPMHRNLQMSQRARAIETWAVIASRGRAGIADLIATSCDQAARLARLLEQGGADLLAPVVLNQALAGFGDDDTTDAVVAGVQAEGTCWVGGTTWKGRRAMRLSVANSATTTEDIDRSAAAILDQWHLHRGR